MTGGGSTATTLTNNNVIAGSGPVGNSNVNIVNFGTITATAGTMTIQPYNTPGSLVNSGLMQANGGVLVINGVDVANAGGVIEAGTSSLAIVNVTVNGGIVRALSGGTVGLSAGVQNVAFSGNIQYNGTSSANVWSGTISNAGTIMVMSGASAYINPFVANATSSFVIPGMLQVSNSGSIFTTGSLTLAGATTLQGANARIAGGAATLNSLTNSNLITGRWPAGNR